MNKLLIGKYIKKKLDEQNIIPNKLAKKMDVTKQAVSNAINGKSIFRIDNLRKLSIIINTPIDEILDAGEPRELTLEQFAKQETQDMNLKNIPKQPDIYGKTLLDYVIESDDYNKYKFLYDRDLFIETMHTSAKLMAFLIRNQKYEELKDEVISIFSLDKNDYDAEHSLISKNFEFPNLENNFGISSPMSRKKPLYEELDMDKKCFVDAIFESKSHRLLNILNYDLVGEYQKDFPAIFYLAIQRDALFVVKHYVRKYPESLTQAHLDYYTSSMCNEYLLEAFFSPDSAYH